MSHLHRFFSPDLTLESSTVMLPTEEAHHAAAAARLREGDALAVFNGAGLEGKGVAAAISKRALTVALDDVRAIAPPPLHLTLAVGGLHRDKAQEEVVRHATELGASRVCFFSAERSQRPIKLGARLVRAGVEACKQCGRSHLPEVDTADSLDELLTTISGPIIAGLLSAKTDAPARASIANRLTVLVGPEGDFSPREEAAILAAGAVAVSLGQYTFRSETAAAFLTALVVYQTGELGPGIHLVSDAAVKGES